MGRVVFFEAGDMAELQAAADRHGDADLVLLDLHMPGVQGLSRLVYLSHHAKENV